MAEKKVPFKVQTLQQQEVDGDITLVCNEGVLTLTEKNMYLGLGKGSDGISPEYIRYDGADTTMMPLLADVTTEGDAIVLGKKHNRTVLYFNGGVPTLVKEVDGNWVSTSLFGEVVTTSEMNTAIEAKATSLRADINDKAAKSDVYTKAEIQTYLQTAESQIQELEQDLQDEEDRAIAKEKEIEETIEKKAKIVQYTSVLTTKLTPPDLVLEAGTLYVVVTEFTPTGNWSTDSVNLKKATPNIKVEIKSYKTGEAFAENELLLYQGTLYPVKTAFTATGTWATDKVNVDETAKSVIFNPDDYYDKTTVDGKIADLAITKQLEAGKGVVTTRSGSMIQVSADMSTDATAGKIVQRDSSGIAYGKNSDNPSGNELVNANTLATAKNDLNTRINTIENKFIGKTEESFSISPAKTLIAPNKMETQNIDCKIINMDVSLINFSCSAVDWGKMLILTIATSGKNDGSGIITATWLKNPTEAEWLAKFTSVEINGTIYDKVLPVTISKGGNTIGILYFNAYSATTKAPTKIDYTSQLYKTYTVVIDMSKAKAKAAPTFTNRTTAKDNYVAKDSATEANPYKKGDLPFLDWGMIDRADGCCYYEDDAVGKNYQEVMDFLGVKPVCLANGEVVEELNPDDYSKQTDKKASSYKTLGRDVMIEFPKRGLRFKWEGSLLKVSITNQEDAEGFTYNAFNRAGVIKDRFYYGAYEGYVDSNMLYSSSGRTPRVNTTLTQFRVYARARNDAANGITGYQLPSYYMLTYLQACYLMVHKSLNSQATVGYGRSSGGSVCATGGSDTWGMNMELLTKADVKRTNQTSNMKVLGIEDFWANAWDWIDGFYIDKNGEVRLSTDPDNYNDTGMGYANGIQTGMFYNNTSNSEIGWVSCVQGTNELGFFPSNASDGAEGAYFCDKYWQLYYRCLAFGGSWADGAYAGAFCLAAVNVASNANAIIACRLAYL